MGANTGMGWSGAAATLALGLGLLAGCSVQTHHNGGEEDNNDVSIRTPIGGLDVHHNTTPESLGLPAYPGAALASDKDSDSANVRMGFGAWQLRVEVLKYISGDGLDKVQAFYRGPLGHYGTVLACRDGEPVGKPVATGEGLTCHDNGSTGAQIHMNFGSPGALELRTGSRHNQHMVVLEPRAGGGTTLTLVRLELPRGAEHESDAQ